MKAVGLASVNKPVFINIAYKGNPDLDEWTAEVVKGICFDTGGLKSSRSFLEKLR
jgi:leucyl aminopeptidase